MGRESENIRVICRFRPINKREIQEAEDRGEPPGQMCVKFKDEKTVDIMQAVHGKHTFNFDRIFPPGSAQKDVYDLAAMDTIEDVLQGYNGTIFAYGQTGAGKSWSMFGADITDVEMRGIIPRGACHIFEHIAKDESQTEYTIKVSFLEIYNKQIRDLLNPVNDNLQVRESPSRGVYVENAAEEFAARETDIITLLQIGESARSVSKTKMNAVSSRSHSIFIVQVQQKSAEGSTKTGKLNLVDLAGSEKVRKTGAKGDTLLEAQNINASLSALGNVINALGVGKKHIPYRDSKLTRMLQESLGGNTKTTLLIACSPHPFNVEETIGTCNFGKRAKAIKNAVKVNATKSVAELMAIISQLNKQLAAYKEYSKGLEDALAWYKSDDYTK
ncbi:kinesin-like protein, partial [Kipferlia bialata]|eukprot:g10391.t1